MSNYIHIKKNIYYLYLVTKEQKTKFNWIYINPVNQLKPERRLVWGLVNEYLLVSKPRSPHSLKEKGECSASFLEKNHS